MSIASLSAKLIRKARPAARRSGATDKLQSGRALQKGQQTKMAIVDAALGLATQYGLEGLSSGALAEATGRGKAGAGARFPFIEGEEIHPGRQFREGLPAVPMSTLRRERRHRVARPHRAVGHLAVWPNAPHRRRQ